MAATTKMDALNGLVNKWLVDSSEGAVIAYQKHLEDQYRPIHPLDMPPLDTYHGDYSKEYR